MCMHLGKHSASLEVHNPHLETSCAPFESCRASFKGRHAFRCIRVPARPHDGRFGGWAGQFSAGHLNQMNDIKSSATMVSKRSNLRQTIKRSTKPTTKAHGRLVGQPYLFRSSVSPAEAVHASYVFERRLSVVRAATTSVLCQIWSDNRLVLAQARQRQKQRLWIPHVCK